MSPVAARHGGRYRHGWYQLGFERDIRPGLTPLAFAATRLMAVRDERGVRVYDAVCPHRGAYLAENGRLSGGAVLCPFHGHRIGLGADSAAPLRVREYPSLVHGGMVFIRLGDRDPADLPAALNRLSAGHRFYNGFVLEAGTRIETVMENGFDSAHFRTVHGLLSDPSFDTRLGECGELVASGHFDIPRTDWNGGAGNRVSACYRARAFSPGVVIAELDGDLPFRYTIITTATPTTGNACRIHLTLALPTGPALFDDAFAKSLLEMSHDGLLKDRAIWNELEPDITPEWTAQDDAARAFLDFCQQFLSDDCVAPAEAPPD